MSEPMGAAGGIDHRMQDHGTEAAGGVTAGQLLRQLRESAGVHVDVLAGTLKVPAAKLHALEADQYDAFPDAVFMRALASGVCRTLKADAAPVLALLPQSGPVQLVVDKGLNASFKDPGHRFIKGGTLERPKSRMMGVTVAALLAAAVAIAFLPKGNDSLPVASSPEAVTPPQRALEATQLDPVTAAVPSTQESVASGGQATVRAEPSSAAVASAALAASAPAAAVEPAPSQGGTNEAGVDAKGTEASGVLVIRARGESWIQVRNAAGGVVLQKILAAGESVSAAGSPPWSVVIGKADATEVVVRGQPMDLNAIARENVARFEVK